MNKSFLTTRASQELKKQIEAELNQPDPKGQTKGIIDESTIEHVGSGTIEPNRVHIE